LCWGDCTPQFSTHLGGPRIRERAAIDIFRDDGIHGRIAGLPWAAGTASGGRRQSAATAHAKGCQAENALGTLPARSIISLNAPSTLALKSASMRRWPA